MVDKKIDNVSQIKDCYGCGICSISCPKRIIELGINSKGFFEPMIVKQDECIDCGLCLNNCAYYHDAIAVSNTPIASYAGWSKDNQIRHNSSSGGVCYEVCKYFITQGYKVCGAKYEPNGNIVTHIVCSTIDELNQISGSKYLQSNTTEGFGQLNSKDKFVVIGTPCQIDSLRRYIKKRKTENNFVLIDFFCHGVPSKKLWNKFSASQTKLIGNFNSVTWRNKADGWHKSYRLDIKAESGEYHHTGLKFDDFFNLYFSNASLSPACFDKCKYKQDQSSADIRIGDMWGAEYNSSRDGINSIICFTEIGHEAILKADCILKPHSLDEVLSGQMKSLPVRDQFYYTLNPLIIEESDNWKEIVSISRRLQLKKRIIRKLRLVTKYFSKK